MGEWMYLTGWDYAYERVTALRTGNEQTIIASVMPVSQEQASPPNKATALFLCWIDCYWVSLLGLQ